MGSSSPPDRPATIYDVARRAGVSTATVSRVMRGTGPVAESTRARVATVMHELRFRPNRLGVSLAKGRHAANGIVFPDLSGPYFAEVVLGYEEQAGELDRSVVILSTHGRSAAPAMVIDLAARVDGLVVLGRTVPDDVVGRIVDSGLPVVMLARPPVDGADSVVADNASSAESLALHVAHHGARDVVLLGDPEASADVAERWQGLHHGFAAAGIRPVERPTQGFDVGAGERAAAELLAGPRPDAVLCANDEIALGVLRTAARAGVSVPDELAVTGWDDVMASSWAGLTTVRQPMRDLGATAARLLDARIGGDQSPPRHELLRTQLVVRSTCGTH